jgi:hypothetical protein
LQSVEEDSDSLRLVRLPHCHNHSALHNLPVSETKQGGNEDTQIVKLANLKMK